MTRLNNNSNEKEPLKSNNQQVNAFKTKEEPSDCYKVDSETDDICELEHLRKLFIGGLAPHTTEDTLKAFYEQWGKVVDVVVMRDASGKRSRGFGFITYAKAFMVDCAQEARPHVLDGKTVEAKRVLPRPEREKRDTNISVKKLFVGGLKHNHDDECLKEYFSQFGKVISVKILIDKATGKRRGFAFIAFDDYDAVDKAVLQKIHSIRNVMVDVKKSVYNLEHRNASANAGANMPGPPLPGYGQQYGPVVPTYNGPPMNFGPPPPNYNYWNQGPPQGLPVPQGPPVPLGPTAPPGPSAPPGPPAPYYGGYQQPPQQPYMNNWNYPPLPPNNWNAGPPPPPGPQLPPANWQPPAQWCPPPAGAPAAVAQTPNWNPTTPAAPQTGQPPVAPQNSQPPAAGPQLVPPQVPPTNFGSGYQQNYGGGPAKNNNINANRMNPYRTQPYGGYGVGPNTAPLNSGNVGRNPVPPGPFGNRRY